VELLDTSTDLVEVATLFDEWCEQTMRPWYDDHVYWDRTELQRFAGQDLDLQQRIPSDVVCECAELDPSIMDAARAYLTMRAGPRILDTVQDEARAVLRTGWRPAYAQGPSRDELIEHALAATA
jgi:hypothetical protein